MSILYAFHINGLLSSAYYTSNMYSSNNGNFQSLTFLSLAAHHYIVQCLSNIVSRYVAK